MQFNHDLTLISTPTTTEYDDYGNPISAPTRRTILCSEGSVGRYDYYQAANANMKAQGIVYVIPSEYDGEKTAVFKGDSHTIERVYPIMIEGVEYLELTLVDKLGDDK